MPSEKQQQDRIKFLADRMAILLCDLVARDCEYGEFCHDEFYEDINADITRETKQYDVAINFVRNMLRRSENGMGTDRQSSPSGEN